MARRAFWVSVLIAGLALLISPTASLADELLDMVPADALGWVVVRHLDQCDAKVVRLAEQVHAPIPSGPLTAFKRSNAIERGFNDEGSLVVIAMPGKTPERPVFLYALPVTNYREFIDQFKPAKAEEKISEITIPDGKHVSAKVGNFALTTESENRAVLEKALAAKQHAAAEVAGLESWLTSQDAVAVVTAAGAKLASKTVADKIADLRRAQPSAATAPLEVYVTLLRQVEKQASLVAVGATIGKGETLRVTTRVRFIAGSTAAGLLANIKPAQGDVLAGLPGGPFFMAGGGITPPSWGEALIPFSVAMMKQARDLYGITPEQAEEIGKASTDTMKSIRGMSVMMKPGKTGEPIYSNIFGLLTVDNTAGFLDKYAKQFEATNEILKRNEGKEGLLKPTKVTKTEMEGKPALELEITIPIPKQAGVPNFDQMMEAMIGPGGKATAYMVVADEHHVVFGYATAKSAVLELMRAVRDAKPGLSKEPDVAATAALLPPGAQWIGYVSAGGYVDLMQRMMAAVATAMGGNGPMITFPPFPHSPPIGVAVKAKGSELRIELVVPGKLFKTIGDYIDTFRKNMLGGAGP
jgi:hypothetical protein